MFLQELPVAAFLGFEDHNREGSSQANFVRPANLGGSWNNCRDDGAGGPLSGWMRRKIMTTNSLIVLRSLRKKEALKYRSCLAERCPKHKERHCHCVFCRWTLRAYGALVQDQNFPQTSPRWSAVSSLKQSCEMRERIWISVEEARKENENENE